MMTSGLRKIQAIDPVLGKASSFKDFPQQANVSRIVISVITNLSFSKESVENLLLNSATVNAYLDQQTADAYNKWLETSYKPMIDKYNNRSELLKNKRFSLEDFD